MLYSTTIGIDTHSNKNTICALEVQTGAILEASFSDDPAEIVRWVGQCGFEKPIMCVYEAGPTGFGLARALNAAGIGCIVAATAKLPKRTDKAKNDRNDAQWLARLLSSGAIRAVRIPSVQEESLCRLSKLRGEAASDLRRAKQRLRSFLLMSGTKYTLTKKFWTKAFMNWARTYKFAQPADTFTFREKLAEVERLSERLARIEGRILEIIEGDPKLKERMARLLCIHGIGTVTAFSLICEVYDFGRFGNGRSFASFLGLVPSEKSTGDKVSHGRITKLGNANLRRLLLEAASCYSHTHGVAAARPGYGNAPAAVAAKARKCENRLFARREALRRRGMSACKAKCAIARELAEWIYYIMVMPA